MLELAAARAAGAHPYFVPVAHTARAREILGTGPLLAPELAVVLDPDPDAARHLARRYASTYLDLPNYTNNLRTFGYGDDDIGGGGSDRLIDAVIRWGDAAAVASRVRDHLEAGADHVCLQVVADRRDFPLEQYRELAELSTTWPPERPAALRQAARRRDDRDPDGLGGQSAAGRPRQPWRSTNGAPSARSRAKARKARPRCDRASFSAASICAKVRPSPPSCAAGTNTGS